MSVGSGAPAPAVVTQPERPSPSCSANPQWAPCIPTAPPAVHRLADSRSHASGVDTPFQCQRHASRGQGHTPTRRAHKHLRLCTSTLEPLTAGGFPPMAWPPSSAHAPPQPLPPSNVRLCSVMAPRSPCPATAFLQASLATSRDCPLTTHLPRSHQRHPHQKVTLVLQPQTTPWPPL